MDTSGTSTLSIAMFLVALATGLQVAIRLPVLNRRFPVIALVLTVAIGVPSLVQYAWHPLGDALMRQPQLELQGQWWRVLTALLAQDGGLGGAIFNLVVVAVVTTLGERVWGRWQILVLFLVPSLILNLLAIAWNAPGGGSSFADLGLLVSMCGLGLVTAKGWLIRANALIPIACGVLLVVAGDAHGLAILIGAALGLAFAFYVRPPNAGYRLPRQRRRE